MRGDLQGVVCPEASMVYMTLCIHCREQLPALVTAAAPLSPCPVALELRARLWGSGTGEGFAGLCVGDASALWS